MWYNSIDDCSKCLEKTGAEIIERKLTKDTEAFKKLRELRLTKKK
jgi:hypothetical protein